MKREGQSFCLKSAVDDSERRFAGWIFPVFLGFLFACGTNAASMASIPFNKLSFYEQWALFSALFCVTFRYGFVLLQKISVEATGEKEENKDESVGKSSKGFVKHFVGWFSFEHQKSWKSKMRDGMRIFMLWLPYILLLYPGIMYWDTGDQVAQFFGISVFGQKPGQIWDHHPFFDTYLYGAFLWLSHAVTGSYIIGIFLHALVQSALTGLVIACWLSYLKERGLQRVPLKVCTMFLCFFPVFPIMFASMSKDITHVVFFLAWSLMFMRLVDSRLEKFKDPRFLIGFFVLSLCAAMSKKIGLYIIVLSLLLLIVGKFKTRLKAIAIGVTIILYLIVNVALPNCYYKQAHIVPSSAQAALAMPIELLGRAAHAYPDDVSNKEKDSVDSYLIYTWGQVSEQYNPYIADPVTGYKLREGASTSDFLKTWLKIGLRHPMTYVNGFFCLESGWITFTGTSELKQPQKPYKHYPVQMDVMTTTSVNPDTFGKLAPSTIETESQGLVKNIIDVLRSVPVLNLLMYIALWASVVPAFLAYVLWRRRRTSVTLNDLLQFVPYYLSVILLFVYPVSLEISGGHGNPTRYMFHTLLFAPMMIGMVLSLTRRENQCE